MGSHIWASFSSVSCWFWWNNISAAISASSNCGICGCISDLSLPVFTSFVNSLSGTVFTVVKRTDYTIKWWFSTSKLNGNLISAAISASSSIFGIGDMTLCSWDESSLCVTIFTVVLTIKCTWTWICTLLNERSITNIISARSTCCFSWYYSWFTSFVNSLYGTIFIWTVFLTRVWFIESWISS